MTFCLKPQVLCIKCKRISFLVGLFFVLVLLHSAHSCFDKEFDSRMKFHLQLLGLSGIFTSQRNVTSVRPHTPLSPGCERGHWSCGASSGPCVLPARANFIHAQSGYLIGALYSKCGPNQVFEACRSLL